MDEAARICMTHSFQIKEIHTYIGNIDVPPEDAEEVEAYLKSVEYDDYDLLIQLCRRGLWRWRSGSQILQSDMEVIRKKTENDAMSFATILKRRWERTCMRFSGL